MVCYSCLSSPGFRHFAIYMLSKMSLSNDVFVQLVLSKPKREEYEEEGSVKATSHSISDNVHRPLSQRLGRPTLCLFIKAYTLSARGLMAFDYNLLKLQMKEM